MLRLDGVEKTFVDPKRGPVTAIRSQSWSADGGVVAIMGANGAGKSTLLRLIATLLQPDAGSISVDGYRSDQDPDAVRRRIGYLSTSTKLYPRLSGAEMLAYTAGFYGLEGAARSAAMERVAAWFDLTGFWQQRCETMSTGQAQRINLARTVLVDPPLLILDEPSTGLDIVSAEQVIAAVQRLRRDGRLVLLSTHNLAEVEALADRLLVLRDGRLVADAPLADLPTGDALRLHLHSLIGLDAQGRRLRDAEAAS